jgi:hypothetical protein
LKPTRIDGCLQLTTDSTRIVFIQHFNRHLILIYSVMTNRHGKKDSRRLLHSPTGCTLVQTTLMSSCSSVAYEAMPTLACFTTLPALDTFVIYFYLKSLRDCEKVQISLANRSPINHNYVGVSALKSIRQSPDANYPLLSSHHAPS